MYWMKVRDLIKLPVLSAPDKILERTPETKRKSVELLKESILRQGWLEEAGLVIADGVIGTGLLRVQAIKELVCEDKLSTDTMVRVEIHQSMLVQRLVKVG